MPLEMRKRSPRTFPYYALKSRTACWAFLSPAASSNPKVRALPERLAQGLGRPSRAVGGPQNEEAPAESRPRRYALGLTSTRRGSNFRPRTAARLIVTSSRSRTTSRLSIKSAVFQPS
jgi:hypothetical protein